MDNLSGRDVGAAGASKGHSRGSRGFRSRFYRGVTDDDRKIIEQAFVECGVPEMVPATSPLWYVYCNGAGVLYADWRGQHGTRLAHYREANALSLAQRIRDHYRRCEG